MICLGFTSSTDHGSVALFNKNKVTQLASWTKKEQASEAITLKIKTGLARKKISFADLNLIAVDKGPGSFTETRIGVNIAKTLSYSSKNPVLSLNSLNLLAHQYSSDKASKKHIFNLIDAHKSLFYFRN